MRVNLFSNWLNKKDSIRVRHIKEWINKLSPKKRLLDAGAGMMPFKELIIKRGLSYTSHDFGKYNGGENWGVSKAELWDSTKCEIISDISNIPVENNSFDYILCTEVLEHVFNPEKVIVEFLRIIKPRGQICITIPFASLPHQKPYFFHSGLSAEWFREIANQNNCQVKIKN